MADVDYFLKLNMASDIQRMRIAIEFILMALAGEEAYAEYQKRADSAMEKLAAEMQE